MLEIAPGSIFATDFRVVRKLAQGGMGAVYEVEQLSTSKRRALKVMLPSLVSDPSLRQRFEQEARLGARIQSEHVVEVVGAGVDDKGVPWLAMELLVGETLDAAMRKRAGFSPEEVARIFEQLCHAVGAAHDAGIVHRDLKPENVFLARSMRVGGETEVKVLDFGVAKIIDQTRQTTHAVGTPLWLAPEQAMQGAISPACDVWALGLIAFNMLAGFEFWMTTDSGSPSIAEVLKEITVDEIQPASRRAAQKGRALPPGFDEWFARAVVRDPRARFSNAREALAALRPVLGGAHYAQPLPQTFHSAPQTLVHASDSYMPTVAQQHIATPAPQPAPHYYPHAQATYVRPAPTGPSGCLIATLIGIVLAGIFGGFWMWFVWRML